MKDNFKRKLNLALSVLLLGLNLIFLNALLGRSQGLRLDLTEGHLYTLSKTTVKILQDLEEPVTLTFYYSSREAQHDWIRPLTAPMKDILSEFGAEGDKKVAVRFVELDTAGEKAQDKAANQFGVRPFALPVKTTFEAGVKNTYFALVVAVGGAYKEYDLGSNFLDLCRFVEQGSGGQQGRLELADIEYLVAKSIHQLLHGFSNVPGALVAHGANVAVTVFLSDKKKLPKDFKDLKETITKVTSALERQSGGRLKTTFKQPFKGLSGDTKLNAAAREIYKQYNVRPYQQRDGKGYYYASLVASSGGQQDFVDFVGSGVPGEADIKSALEGLIKPMIPGFLPTVGLVMPKSRPDPMAMRMGQRPQPSEFATVKRQLQREYQVEDVSLSGDRPSIPRKVEVLVLVRPEKIAGKALYAVDQFVMRGGRLVVLADANHFDRQGARFSGGLPVKTTDLGELPKLLTHWGIQVGDSVLEDTRSSTIDIPVPITIGGARFNRIVPAPYPMALIVDGKGFSRTQPITASVQAAALFWANSVKLKKKLAPDVKGETLAWTSKDASTILSVPDLRSVIQTPYAPPKEARRYPLMAALRGRFTSYFADKPIPGLDTPAATKEAKSDGAGENGQPGKTKKKGAPKGGSAQGLAFKGAPLKKSRTTSVVVLGDSDFLSPQVLDLAGLGSDTFIEHMKLLKNAIDWGGPDAEILTIRNRTPGVRVLTGFRGLTPEKKKSAGVAAAWLTTGGSCAAVLLLALLWFGIRSSKKPLPLPEASTAKGGDA